MDKRHLIIGSVVSALAVAIGAFGAHALAPLVAAHGRTETYDTAVQYHMFHAIGIFIVGILMVNKPHKILRLVSWFFLFGIILFSGSLYTLSITGITILGAITPIGGVLFIAGWILLAYYLSRHY